MANLTAVSTEASASAPATSTTDQEEQEQSVLVMDQDDDASRPPPAKKSTLFASYAKRRLEAQRVPHDTIISLSPTTVATAFVEKMVSIASSVSGEQAWSNARSADHYNIMHHVMEKLFCIPASSAPVERVFSQGGLIMRPHRARLGDEMLSSLVYLKCNSHVQI